jgi:hypothetical protein
MSDTKRGAPPKDGEWWDVKVGDTDTQLRWQNGQFVSPGGGWYAEHTILAHRKHQPVEVPPLKELRVAKMAVVKVGPPDEPYVETNPTVALITESGVAAYHSIRGGWSGTKHFQALTREQCEAAGYKWPFPIVPGE